MNITITYGQNRATVDCPAGLYSCAIDTFHSLSNRDARIRVLGEWATGNYSWHPRSIDDSEIRNSVMRIIAGEWVDGETRLYVASGSTD